MYKETTLAISNLATGVYNMLKDANGIPEIRYNPGKPIYGTSPVNVSEYARSELSPASEAALRPYIPTYGHPSATTRPNLSRNKTAPGVGSPEPLSFAVISSSVQEISSLPISSDSNTNGGNLCSRVPIKTNYLSLALQDGFAVFEIDDSGVYEVMAHLQGDSVLKDLLLRHTLDDDRADRERCAAIGAPPQAAPQHFLDVKVVERCFESAQPSDSKNDRFSPVVNVTPLDGGAGKSVTITSRTPIVTLALLTDTFHHYRSPNGATEDEGSEKDSVCDQHQRIMIVECLPQCILVGADGDTASTSSKPLSPPNSHTEMFVPLPNESQQQNDLWSQTVGLPFFPLIQGRVTSAHAGLLYRIVSHTTLVNKIRMVSMSPFPSQGECCALDKNQKREFCAPSAAANGVLAVLSEPTGTSEPSPGTLRRVMCLLSFTIHVFHEDSLNPTLSVQHFPSKMVVLRTMDVSNGAHAVSKEWLAYAGAPDRGSKACPSAAQPLYRSDTQTIIRAEHTVTNSEYFAKTASTKLSIFGNLFGAKKDSPSPSEENRNAFDSKHDLTLDHSQSSSQSSPLGAKGVVTIVDVSMITAALISPPSADASVGFYNEFASFAAHSNALQTLAFDDSGSLLATASTNGTSINVYQISKSRQRREGSRMDLEMYRDIYADSSALGKRGHCNRKPNAVVCVPFFGSDDDDDDDGGSPKHVGKRWVSVTSPDRPAIVGEVTLLYRLLRGATSAVVTSLSFSPLSLSLGVATSLGTCHFYVLDDTHAVRRESSEQYSYFQSDTSTGVGQKSSTIHVDSNAQLSDGMRNDGPFTCFHVGVRGELASLRRAPLVDPVCRLRSSNSESAHWPQLSFRPLPPYRDRSAVATIAADKQHRGVGINNEDPPRTSSINTATFNCLVVCPASISVTCVQFNVYGDAVSLYSCRLGSFMGPTWGNAISMPAPTSCQPNDGRVCTPASYADSSSEILRCEDITWLLQLERHCARASEYSWSITATGLTYTPNIGNATFCSGGGIWGRAGGNCPILYQCAESTHCTSPSARQRYVDLLSSQDDTADDLFFSQSAEDSWDVTPDNDDIAHDPTISDDFVVA